MRVTRFRQVEHMQSHPHAGHAHRHAAFDTRDGERRLRIALVLTTVFLVAEVVGGIVSNSLALLADAGHMLTDVAALGLSLFVAWFGRRPETPKRTYGYLRLEILAAFVNGATLLLLSAWIIWEAFSRLRDPEPIATGIMLIVASGGLLINVASALILHPSRGTSLNVRGAYLHVLGDLLGSVGTVVAALLVRYTGWYAADPMASIFVTVVVMRSAWGLVRESVDILLESTPAHISAGAVRAQIEAIPGIESVHDLHVW
ncbi:MAG: cation diffusion facilitator family transporter, partial [Gemmatimonadaceae bacterium]